MVYYWTFCIALRIRGFVLVCVVRAVPSLLYGMDYLAAVCCARCCVAFARWFSALFTRHGTSLIISHRRCYR